MKKIYSIVLIILCVFLCACSTDEVTQTETSQVSLTEQTSTEEPSTVQASTVAQEQTESEKIDRLMDEMTLEEKVGQMFYVRCPDSQAIDTISQYHLGGYILFGRDFQDKTKDEIISTIQSYQEASEIPMLIGVDEEGGTVVRVSDNSNLRETPFLSPSDTYYKGGWQQIKTDENEKADLLLSLGINVNMAPVCDVTSDPNAFMYYRSFSSNVENQSCYVETVVEICKNKNLGTVLKHFPGYGNNTDTHTGIAYDERTYVEFEENDFIPFKDGIKSGADCVLIAHNIVKCMDYEYPASLSENVHRILREDLDFDGVIMTDDLSMEAITDYTGSDTAAVFAAKCGNDILCCTDVETQYPAVLNAVQSGEIPLEQIESSVKRILIWKQNLGLL